MSSGGDAEPVKVFHSVHLISCLVNEVPFTENEKNVDGTERPSPGRRAAMSHCHIVNWTCFRGILFQKKKTECGYEVAVTRNAAFGKSFAGASSAKIGWVTICSVENLLRAREERTWLGILCRVSGGKTSDRNPKLDVVCVFNQNLRLREVALRAM